MTEFPGAREDEGYQPDPQLESLSQRFERDGVDTRLLEEPFLEASELGDAASLEQRLLGLSPDERRKLVRNVDQQGRTGLLLAVGRGDLDLSRVLLDGGANPNDAESGGVTALHLASSRGRVGTVELLLRCCAEVGRSDDMGETPLMWASGAGAVRLLLEARAEANARSSAGRTALMTACGKGDLAAVDLLAKLPDVDLDAVDSSGASAHAIALAAGCPEAGDLLLQLGAVPSAVLPLRRVVRRDEALHEAARRGDASGCEAALEGGALDVDVEVAGETPLLLAAGAGAGRAMEVLLKARADPNRGDQYLHETPLLRAVLGGCSHELLWLLLEAKADPTQADLGGRTPADVAASWGNAEGAELLRAAAGGRLGLSDMD